MIKSYCLGGLVSELKSHENVDVEPVPVMGQGGQGVTLFCLVMLRKEAVVLIKKSIH